MSSTAAIVAALLAALALLVPAGAAGGETAVVVPPENSAATQYTEAVPTAGGDKPSGGHGRKPTPAKVLGGKNAKRLESQGSEGREVARVVAETAPTPTPVETSRAAAAGSDAEQPGKAGGDRSGGGAHVDTEAGKKSDSGAPAGGTDVAATELPSGSSGLGEVLAEATGSSSSGQLGALLPLAILAALAWALAFFWRQRLPAD